MKRCRKMIAAMLAAVVLLAAGCQKSAGITESYPADYSAGITESYPTVYKEDLFKESELILLGKVLQKAGEYMRDTENDANNYLAIEYTIQPQEIYLGAVEGETLAVKIRVGSGLSSDLIVYGTDGKVVPEEAIDHDPLQVGEQVLLFLKAPQQDADERFAGYFVSTRTGLFRQTWIGHWVDMSGERMNLLTLRQEVAAAKGLPTASEPILLEGAMEPPLRTVKEILKDSESIYRGIVTEKHTPQMTDPQNNTADHNGFPHINRQVTRYTIAVEEEYRSCPFDTEDVLIANGIGLSAELITNGADGAYRLAKPLEIFELEVGGEYIICTDWVEEPNEAFLGRYAVRQMCFKKQPDGRYVNAYGEELDPQKIK